MSAAVSSSGFLKKVKGAILAIEPNAEIILFGSRVIGGYRPDSDWDLLVITDQAKNSGIKHTIRDRLADFLFDEDALLSALFIQKSVWVSGKSPSPVISEVRKDGIKL